MTAKAPANLGAKAKRLWSDITGTYQLRPDELRILEDACREVDLIERMEALTADEDFEMIAEGSMRQPVANPIIQELRQHRSVLQRLLVGLKLPDHAGGTENPRSVSAREAALARWGHGAKAR